MGEISLTQMLDKVISESLKDIGTSIPAHILEFDVETQLAKVQIAIEFHSVDGDSFAIAPIVNVPVYFGGGNAFILEHQIDTDDEGLLIVAQRCIDGWKEQGGVAPQTVLRKLDMQDAIFIPGVRSKPNVITDFQNDGVRIRSKDGTRHIHLKNTGEIEVKNEGATVSVKTDGLVKGSNDSGYFELQAAGDFVANDATMTVDGDVKTSEGISLRTHTHVGNIGIPTSPPIVG